MKLRHAELVTPANPRLPGKSAGVIGVVSSALLGWGFGSITPEKINRGNTSKQNQASLHVGRKMLRAPSRRICSNITALFSGVELA